MEIEYSQSTRAWSMPKMHSHTRHELYFLISGQRRYFVGDTIYDVQPGDLVLIPVDRLHRTVDTGHYERYVLYFSAEECRLFTDMVGAQTLQKLLESGCLRFSVQSAQRIEKDLQALYRELSENRPYRNGVSLHLLHDILLEALRYGVPKDSCRGENTGKIQTVARYISENYEKEITLKVAAELACMEHTYFSKQFKALTGFCFQEYLTQVRLVAAQQLLVSSDLSMAEVAERCGFGGGNYFGDVFRKYRGMSPSAYRKANSALHQETIRPE